MYFAESAPLREWRILEIIRLDAEVRGDMVTDHFEPMPLLCAEYPATALLAWQPDLEVGVDPLGEGDEFVVLVDGEAHERHEVGENAAARGAPNLGFFQRGVGL